MPSSKIQNKLEEQILYKIELLLDKPISPKSTKQILDLIRNDSSPKQKIFYLIQLKFRGDLIKFMLQNYPEFVGQRSSLPLTFATLQKNIMKYEQMLLKQIWKQLIIIIYSNENVQSDQNQELIYKFGYQELLKQGLKTTNLQKKNTIFGLMHTNIELFWDLGLKENLRKVIITYVQVFIKFSITVPNYTKIIELIIGLTKKSNETEQQQSSSSDIKLHKLPQVNHQFLRQIVVQICNILFTTQQKPSHYLHNCLLLTLQKILSYQGNNILKKDLIYSINRVLEVYLYRKGTRDEARKLSFALQKVNNYLELLNKQKMACSYSSSKLANELDQKPVLIENVIQKTNRFLAKYHVNSLVGNFQNNQNQKQFLLKNSNFLKRGDGNGGGKAMLEIQMNEKQKNAHQKEQTKKKDKFQLLLESCFSKSSWPINDKKSTFNPFPASRQKVRQKNVNSNHHEKHKNVAPKSKIQENLFRQYQMEQNFKKSICSQYQQGMQRPQRKDNLFESCNFDKSSADKLQFNDAQVNQINQLIDLAYSFKFSIN